MNREELAKAYRNIGVAYIQAAEVLEGGEVVDQAPPPDHDDRRPNLAAAGLRPLNGAAVPPAPSPRPAGTADPSLGCPEHGGEWLAGRYGLYCPAKGTDPAWTNRKGYCTITPESAAQYAQIHAQR